MFKTNEERRRARFWHRLFTGAEAADRLRFLTLNSSDESIVLGIEVVKSFSKLVKRMRRKYGVFEYFGVVACDENEPLREHIHVICKCEFMPQREIEDMWIGVHRSIKPYIEAVDDVAGAARYIGKYLHMQSYHVRKYIMSAGWVFPGWVSWSRWFKRNYGVYPDQKFPGILAKLARMSKSARDKIILPELMKMEGL
ncbi:MAG TPA: hypothetical protein VMW50_15010 [Dehalococcoidia bacterium]|nr:hypothetical protein [Dehalococcoidia bacterium]